MRDIIVEAPILDQDFIGNIRGTGISFTLGLKLDHAGIDNAMTHVLVLSAEVRRNEQLK